jgi:hypothetical protein
MAATALAVSVAATALTVSVAATALTVSMAATALTVSGAATALTANMAATALAVSVAATALTVSVAATALTVSMAATALTVSGAATALVREARDMFCDAGVRQFEVHTHLERLSYVHTVQSTHFRGQFSHTASCVAFSALGNVRSHLGASSATFASLTKRSGLRTNLEPPG